MEEEENCHWCLGAESRQAVDVDFEAANVICRCTGGHACEVRIRRREVEG
jgi:hypothetical protein